MKLSVILSCVVVLGATLTLGQNACVDKGCKMYCEFGFKKDTQGCDVCQCQEKECRGVNCAVGKVCKVFTSNDKPMAKCVDPRLPTKCQPPAVIGRCKAALERWYYDTDSSECKIFYYGGCEGNDNRFDSQTGCQQACAFAVPAKASEVVAGCGDKPMCDMECEFGFKPDRFGCPTCQCAQSSSISVECEKPLCLQYCPAGFRRDEFGCEICECNAPGDRCLPVMCEMECFHGFVKDANGCDTCECLTKPACPSEMCAMYCEFGFKKDANGCDVCQCAPKPATKPTCSPVSCTMYCEFGFKKDANGCDTCACKAQATVNCSPVMCAMYCEFGFQKDANGCDVCQCASQDPSAPCIQCMMYCEFGFLKRQDNSGCPLCACAENPCNAIDCQAGHKCKAVARGNNYDPVCLPEAQQCSQAQCRKYCEHGFAMDEKGCLKCECLETPAPQQCPMFKCKPCSFGYGLDQFGCRTCQCLPNPCQNTLCHFGEVCVVDRVPDCYVCAASGHCSDPVHVNSASVNITLIFSSQVANPGQLERLEHQLHEQMSSLLKTHNDHLRDFQIIADNEATVEVKFYMVKSDFANLPSRLDDVRQSFESNWDQLSIPSVDDTMNSVVTGHIAVVYFSDDTVPQCDIKRPRSSRTTLVALCAVVIFGALVTLVIALIVQQRKRANFYYGPKGISSISKASYSQMKNSPNHSNMI